MSENTHQPTSVIQSVGADISKTTNVDTILKKADLNWEVRETPLEELHGADVKPLRLKLLTRSDNNMALGIVGQDYTPSDPRKFIEAQCELAEHLKGNLVQAGFVPGKARAFAFVRMSEDMRVSVRAVKTKGKMKLHDPVDAYVHSADGWDGGTPRTSSLFLERLVCKNGMVTRQLSSKLWTSHAGSIEERFEPKWKEFFNVVADQLDEVEETFRGLFKAKMTSEEMQAFLMQLIPGGGRAEKRRDEIGNLFTNGLGNEGSTRWDALNAVTEYATHHRSYRDGGVVPMGAKRYWKTVGRVSERDLQHKALKLLLEAN